MTNSNQIKWFSEIEAIITDENKFKIKLAIGEDAYQFLRIKKAAWEIWDVAGVAGSGAWFAQLPWVASFLGSKGVLASLGFATATTPIGWVILAGVLSGGAWLGITRYLKSLDGGRVDVIPKFINTPLDALALGLFDLIAPLALKVAKVDDNIDFAERQAISSYFVKEWGYDQQFVEEGIAFIESKLDDYKITNLTQTLAEFQKQNPDCNYNSMSKEFVSFLRTVIEADGRIDEREEMAVEKVKMIFDEVDRINFKQMTKSVSDTISETVVDTAKTIKTKSGEAIEKTGGLAADAIDTAKEHGEKATILVSETYDSTIKMFDNLTNWVKGNYGRKLK